MRLRDYRRPKELLCSPLYHAVADTTEVVERHTEGDDVETLDSELVHCRLTFEVQMLHHSRAKGINNCHRNQSRAARTDAQASQSAREQSLVARRRRDG